MKLIKTLLFISTIALNRIVTIDDIDPINNETSYHLSSKDLFGGFNENTFSYSSSVSFNLTNSTHIGLSTFSIYMFEDNQSTWNNEKFFTHFNAVKGINTVNYTLNFPNGFNYDNGMNFYFELGTAYGSTYAEYSCKIYPSPKEIFIGSNNKNNVVLDRYLVSIGSNNRFIEKYDFTNIGDYFTNDRYYCLLFSDLSFSYQSSYFLTHKNAKIYFNDIDNLFPYLPSVNDRKYIDLYIVKKSGQYCFEIANDLYVEPNNLYMAYDAKAGYVKVNKFYLPRGKQEKFDGYIFNLYLYELGKTKTTFITNISFDIGYSLIGDCISSDYCVIGGVRV